MKANQIKVGHIYYVNYNPTKKGEFGEKHLAVVLKRNADKITFVTIPMTSKQNGEGINKISLGHLECLPINLQNKDSYAVIDQIRTVNSSRFYNILDQGKPIEVIMPQKKMNCLYKAIIKDLLHDVPDSEYKNIFFD